MIWQHFKYSTYMVGMTVMLGLIAKTNLDIAKELLYWDKLYAFIVYQLAILMYPLWLISMIVIVREWKSQTRVGTISNGDTEYYVHPNKLLILKGDEHITFGDITDEDYKEYKND